jgi:2-polyprenyl-6-methoxyphenol hydroxylase-like FAD-dependent oxidoreductase
VYVAHPTAETVVGKTALEAYLRKEAAEQGDVRVRMGAPVVEGNRCAAEFWVEAAGKGREATITGCFIARIAPDGRCSLFREYWFDVDGKVGPFAGWGQ